MLQESSFSVYVIIIGTQRSVFTIPDESEHSGVQASYSRQMEIITKEVGRSHSYTHITRTILSIDLLVAVSLNDKTEYRRDWDEFMVQTQTLLFPCDLTLKPVTSTAPPHTCGTDSAASFYKL